MAHIFLFVRLQNKTFLLLIINQIFHKITKWQNYHNEPKHLDRRNDPKFSERQVWANSADPDHSNQALHCLQFPLHRLDALLYCKAILLKF